MMQARTRSIAVFGGGIAATAAAAAFRRALPGAQVTLFASASEPEYPGAAAPYIHEFHRLIGLQAELFRHRTGAAVVAEAELRRAREPVRMVPVSEMPHVDGAALHQLWLRHTAADPAAGPGWTKVAERARRRDDVAEGLGVRFDAGAYLALLRELAAHLGVKLNDDAAGLAELGEAHDLVIDAAEPAEAGGLRLEGMPGSLHWQVDGAARPSAETIDIGRSHVSWSNAAWRAAAALGDAGPAGRLLVPWTGKILAVGRAALQCETFDGQPLAVALVGIARALELLPRPGGSGREISEYNRRTNLVHDFLLDWAAERWGAAVVPAGLAGLRGQFEQRGRIPFRDEDPVPAGQWLSWLLGSGARPRHIDLTAMRLPEDRLAELFAGF